MKFDQLTDGLLEILNSFDYSYTLFDEDGNKTSNPYNTRYIYVDRPNMMFILDHSNNRVEFHKSNFNFKTFKKILNVVRRYSLEFFIDLVVSNYNQTFKPKDFSKDIMRRRYNLNREMDAVSENYKSKTSNKKLLSESHDGITIYHKLDKEGFYKSSFIKMFSETININGANDNDLYFFIESAKRNELSNKLVERVINARQVYYRLDEKSKQGLLDSKERELYKKSHALVKKLDK
ncbi:hypothetical protein PBI_SCTP2_201 [Salicola phage SCTP-2]|nr:hypothetical protein PBI_SCTP2_201 [Salicola phage SCTP-2]